MRKNEGISRSKFWYNWGFFALPLLGILVLYLGVSVFSNKKVYVDYPTFLSQVESSKINEIKIKDDFVDIKYKDGSKGYTPNPNSLTFKEDMLKSGVEVSTSRFSKTFFSILNIIITISIITMLIIFIKQILNSFKKSVDSISNPTAGVLENKKFKPLLNSNTKFSDVAGIDEAKESLMEVVHYIKNPKELVEMGVKNPSGILLSGDPGNGKTLLAKAVAGEANVPFFSISGSDFVEKFVGVGASRIRDLFKEARQVAPAIIFIDEIDAVGKKRDTNGATNDEREQTLNQLLVEMDGLTTSDGIVVIAATNRTEILDPALKRAGRFDRHIEVSYPDFKGREMILKVHSKNKSLDETVDLSTISRNTVGLSGADLENILNQSGYIALRNKNKSISQENILDAIDEITIGIQKKRNIMTDKEKERTAYHEVGHALANYFIAHKTIEKISILPVSNALGYVKPTQIDKVSMSKEDYLNSICVDMAGKAAEELIYGTNNVSSGPSQDLKNATNKAYNMVFQFGMSKLGPISLDTQILDKVSDKIKNLAFEEVQNILSTCYDKTLQFLKENRSLLEKTTKEILDRETLNRDEFNDFLSNKCNIPLPVEVMEFIDLFERQFEEDDREKELALN